MEAAGADGLHLDIMDGHFVRNLTMGPQIVSAINKETTLFLDVHLMIYQPFDYIEAFAAAGADRITIHFEATENISDTLAFIKRCNLQTGLAFCPETSESMIMRYLDQCDLLLMMGVNQDSEDKIFKAKSSKKISFVKKNIDLYSNKPDTKIQVDGGINDKTIEQVIATEQTLLSPVLSSFSTKILLLK